jgi:hypothetical protein
MAVQISLADQRGEMPLDRAHVDLKVRGDLPVRRGHSMPRVVTLHESQDLLLPFG